MRPYIICHMVQSVDGRIDCDVMEKIDDTNHYYETLDSLNCDATIEGRKTLEMHYAEDSMWNVNRPRWGEVGYKEYQMAGQQVYKAKESDKWAVGAQSQGILSWGDDTEEKFGHPLILIMSEWTDQAYLDYLKTKGISYITVGDYVPIEITDMPEDFRGEKMGIDIPAAMEILAKEFGIKRLAVVGGGHLNGSFLDLGLIDEISMLYASGIDAREGMTSSFDGRAKHKSPIRLNLTHVEQLDDLIWAKYTIKNNCHSL